MGLYGLLDQFFDLVIAPYTSPDMLWILIPLLISVISMELYFGRYKYEELGWSSAFGNAIVLIFVGLDLMRYLYNSGSLGFQNIQNLLAIAILLEGLLLTLIGFFHVLPKEWAFKIAAKAPTSVLAYIAIILIYSRVDITFSVILMSVLLGIILTWLLGLFRAIVPKAIDIEGLSYEAIKGAPKPR